ncbi:putative transcription elongation factor TFIIS [Chlorella virus XW01]|nr:putative transcription elongation factor TFIIS [Chlorella virus XW01]
MNNINTKTRNNNVLTFQKTISKTQAKDLEESILEFSIKYAEENETPFLFEQIYDSKIDEIINQLKNSDSFVQNIKDNKFNIKEIPYLKPEDLYPEKFEKIVKKKAVEKAKKDAKATTNVFKCPKCKKRKATVVEKQTRAADEPATVFITCEECGYTWTDN